MMVLFPAMKIAATTPIIAPFVVRLSRVVNLKGSQRSIIPKTDDTIFAISHLLIFSFKKILPSKHVKIGLVKIRVVAIAK